MGNATEFGERLRGLLKKHGITQADLAKKCNMEANYISQLVNGHRLPSHENLVKLCEAFTNQTDRIYLAGI